MNARLESAAARVLILLAVLFCPLAAQLAPKATDYPAHAKARDTEIGARYLPHGLPAGAVIQAGKDLLVVEVGVFPDPKSAVTVSKSQFTLNIDGKDTPAVLPVAESARGSLAPVRDSSARNDSVQLGGAPQFEHSRSSPELEMPQRRPISLGTDSTTASGDPARKTVLPEGLASKPVSGYLFFHFAGDPNTIRSLELIYSSGGTKTRVRLL